MSRRCPECLRANEDSRTFCTHCGATLDPHLRLIQDLERQTETASQKQAEARKEDLSFYVNRAPQEEKKHRVIPWLLLALAAAAAVWFFMNR